MAKMATKDVQGSSQQSGTDLRLCSVLQQVPRCLVRNTSHTPRVRGTNRRSTAQNALRKCYEYLQKNSMYFSQTLVQGQIPDTLHLHGCFWKRDGNETGIRNKWGE